MHLNVILYSFKNLILFAKIKMTLIFRIRKRQLELLGHTTRKEGPENLTLAGHTEGMRGKEKQQITYLMNLYKWIAQWGLREIVKRQILLELQRIGSCGEL